MSKKYLNLILFSMVVIFIVSLPIVLVDDLLPQGQSPWHLQPFGADSLSKFYKENYRIYGEQALVDLLEDPTKTTVSILIDGWGVPYDEEMLKQDFAYFENNSPEYAVHKRVFNYTVFAEENELQKDFAGGLFIYGGPDSVCSGKVACLKSLFSRIECCENCGDLKITSLLDSVLAERSWTRIALTTYQTREGDRDSLHLVLSKLSEISKKYKDVQFVIQGTHRPILGTPETRRKYLAPWVPAVFVNANTKTAN